MRGVILAGGKGTRLLPVTQVVNKHMVPILNRPMITYPLGTLKSLGISDILVVSGGDHIGGIAEFLGDGSGFGVSFTYRVQRDAGGIAQALGLARDFANGQAIAVILGDNIFDNQVVSKKARGLDPTNAHIFTKIVKDPQRFGVVTPGGLIVEKPKKPKSNQAVTGLYVYPPEVFGIIPALNPSARGELEITDVNNYFIQNKKCVVHSLGNAFWSDAGTPQSLFEVTVWAFKSRKTNLYAET